MIAKFVVVVFVSLLLNLVKGDNLLDPITPSSSKTEDLCLEKKDIPGSHNFFSDWLRAFHRYNTFQTYPQLTSALLMDIKESSDKYVIHVDMPGIEKDKIKITISPNQQELQISAYKEGIKQETGEDFKMVERVTGQLSRLVYLPASADVENLKANYNNGVLEVLIPKMNKDEEEKHTRYIIVE